MSIRTLCVFGTRPEAIKMAPLARLLAADPLFESQLCVTGQHRHMLDQVLALFGLQPDFDLDVMVPGQELADLTSRILGSVSQVFSQCRPDLVFVHGDTVTAFAVCLAAYYQKIPVAHVEAGLRTGNLYSPWPEEGSRKLIACLARMHFAPTERAAANLLREGVAAEHVRVTGNTVIDALQMVVQRLDQGELDARKFGFRRPGHPLLMVTGHRRENFGEGFARIIEALTRIARELPEVDIVYPVHLNPNVNDPVRQGLAGIGNVHLLEPLDYLDFVCLLRSADVILTDSGGVQEEAAALGKPVLVMRDTTERPEAVNAGFAQIVGTDVQRIVAETVRLLRSGWTRPAGAGQGLYGDGTASQQIIEAVKAWARAERNV